MNNAKLTKALRFAPKNIQKWLSGLDAVARADLVDALEEDALEDSDEDMDEEDAELHSSGLIPKSSSSVTSTSIRQQ